MASKLQIDMTPQEFLELAVELRRLADSAVKCAQTLEAGNLSTFPTDGVNHGIEGIDSWCRVFWQIIPRFDTPIPEFKTMRAGIETARSTRALRQSQARDEYEKIANETPPQAKPPRQPRRKAVASKETHPSPPKKSRKPRT